GVAFSGLLLPAGAVGDRYGRKGALLLGLLVFAGASVAVLWVDGTGTVIAIRAGAGMAAALIMPMTLSIITNAFPSEERGRVVGVWSGVFGGAGLIGILIAGGLLEAFSWRSLFVFNAALAALALVATALLVPTSRDPHATPLDLPGAAFSVAGVTALVFAIVEGPERGWSDPLVAGGFAVAALGVALFAWWELRAPHPMLDLRIPAPRSVRRLAGHRRGVAGHLRRVLPATAVPPGDPPLLGISGRSRPAPIGRSDDHHLPHGAQLRSPFRPHARHRAGNGAHRRRPCRPLPGRRRIRLLAGRRRRRAHRRGGRLRRHPGDRRDRGRIAHRQAGSGVCPERRDPRTRRRARHRPAGKRLQQPIPRRRR